MKTLIQTTFPILALVAIPFLFYTSFIWGFNLNETNPTTESLPVEQVFEFKEEPYIDDIPFDTEKVAEQVKHNQSLQVEFELEDEEMIDDIPFNTTKIASSLRNEVAEN